jgi:hypothetical protein
VVAIGELLIVLVTDRVRLTDVVRVIVPEEVPVPRRDAGTVTGGERVILRDFVRLTDTVRDRVMLTDRVILTDTVGLIDRVNG